MSLFFYEALDPSGRNHKGEIEAQSERDARQLLKQQQLVLRRIRPFEAERGRSESAYGRGRLSQAETALFLQQLTTLIGAGMPLSDALTSISESSESKRSRRVISSIRQQVVEGSSLAAALRSRGFEEIICNMVAAGEQTGELEAVSSRLAALIEHRQGLKQELMSALLYPAIIMGFGVVVMLFLLTVVVPQMSEVFDRMGAELPAITRWMIALASFLNNYGLWLLAGVVASVIGYRLLMRLPAVSAQRDEWLLHMPALRGLLLRIETARFSHTLGMLLSGGVPVLTAMQIATESLALKPIRSVAEAAAERLRGGGSLAEALKSGGYFPSLAIRLIGVGEASGQLGAMLLKVAKNYESEVSRRLKQLVVVLEPLLVLLMAVAVGALALAVLLPILEMNRLVQ